MDSTTGLKDVQPGLSAGPLAQRQAQRDDLETPAQVTLLHGLGRFIEPAPSITVMPPSPRGLIVSPISAVSTAVVAWISIHRSRADALLKELQIEKMKLEMEKLHVEMEKARLADERQRPPVLVAAA